MEIYPVISEEWRPIPSLDGWYEASSLGRIRKVLELRKEGHSMKTIASQMGCSRRLVGMILDGSRWGHITEGIR